MVFGLFSKERALQKAISKATNQRAHAEDRMAAMEKLRDDGGDEALLALCKRFSFNYDKSIQDQQEKDWVVGTLAALGKGAVEPLRRYMKSAKSLGYPLKVIAEICSVDEALSIADEILADEEPGYTRDPKRRIDVIEWLSEWEEAPADEVARRVAPYLADFDENVRFKCIEAIALKPSELGAEPLVEALLNEEEESARIRQRIAEVLAENDFPLGDRKKDVGTLVSEQLTDFKLHRDKLRKK